MYIVFTEVQRTGWNIKVIKTKYMCNHKNAFEESEEYPNGACCAINSKEWLGCHDIILSSGGYFEHICFTYVCW